MTRSNSQNLLPFLFACAVGSLTPLSAKQTPAGAGPFSPLANGISLDDSSQMDYVRIKAVGDQTVFPPPAQTPPVVVGVPAVPDYSFTALFGALAPLVEIDAMSTGNDLLFVDSTGQLDVSQRWAAMTYSVTHDSPLNDPGNPLTGQTGPGAHMFSHIFSGSQWIFQGLLGQTQVAQSPQNMGLDQAGDVIPELDGMDFAVPLITMNQGTSGGLLFVNEIEFYFSVTRASASQLQSKVLHLL